MSGMDPVLLRVHVLQIEQKKISMGQNAMKSIRGCKTTGVDSNMQTTEIAFGGERFENINVGHWFTAGEGYAAAGLLIKNMILHYFFEGITNGKKFSGDFSCIVQTIVDAFAASVAAVTIDWFAGVGRDRLMRAMGNAATAAIAFFCVEQ